MDLRLQSSDDGDLNTYSMMFGENDGSTTPHSLSDDHGDWWSTRPVFLAVQGNTIIVNN